MRNPHTEDPIYQFYKKEADETNKAIEKQQEEVAKATAAVEKARPQNNEKRELVEILFEQKGKLEKLFEKKDYIDLKIKEIIKEDQAKYKTAYENKKPWPDPSEYEAFKLKKELDEFKNVEWKSEKRVKKYQKRRGIEPQQQKAQDPAESTH